MKIVCECGKEVGIDNSDAVGIAVGNPKSKSWIHACVCSGCSRVYWYHTGDSVVTDKNEMMFFVDGRTAIKNGKGFIFV